MSIVWIQKWEETERGWGVRPDGYTIHKEREHIAAFLADMRTRESAGKPKGWVPEEYSRPDGEPFQANLSDSAVLQDLANSDHGLWGHGTIPKPREKFKSLYSSRIFTVRVFTVQGQKLYGEVHNEHGLVLDIWNKAPNSENLPRLFLCSIVQANLDISPDAKWGIADAPQGYLDEITYGFTTPEEAVAVIPSRCPTLWEQAFPTAVSEQEISVPVPLLRELLQLWVNVKENLTEAGGDASLKDLLKRHGIKGSLRKQILAEAMKE